MVMISDSKEIDFDGMSLGAVSDYIKELIAEHGPSSSIDYEYYGYDGAKELYLKFDREETDKERDKRLKLAQFRCANKVKVKAVKEEKERAEYDRLQKKFG